MNPFQESFDRIKVVSSELATVQRVLNEKLANAACFGSERHVVSEARANTERTYLLRLFAEFEGALTVLGPSLSNTCFFGPADGLSFKLDQVGSRMGIDQAFRSTVNRDLRDLRNELMHGRSRIPRVPYDRVSELMRAFLRWCR